MRFLAYLILLLLAGCATSNKYQLAEFDKFTEQSFPPISIFYKRPSEDFRKACDEFDDKGLLSHCQINRVELSTLVNAFAETKLFPAVHFANESNEYQLLVTSATYNLEDAAELSSAALAGATLMLAPVSMSMDIRVEAVLAWRGVKVEEYLIEIPFTQKASLLNMSNNPDMDISRSLASHFIQKFQDDDIFDPEVLVARLESSDYKNSLIIPETVNSFSKEEMHIYNHPFEGVLTRYVDDDFQFSYIDVFVYPIRKIDWDDQLQTLNAELKNYRQDISLMEKEGYLEDVVFKNQEVIYITAGGRKIPVIRLVNTHENDEQGIVSSEVFLAIQKDKFIKIRADYKTDFETPIDVEMFARELYKTITVPDESLFMARIRKNWRDSAQL